MDGAPLAEGDGSIAAALLAVPARLAAIKPHLLAEGGPHTWGLVALLGWELWFLTQAPWGTLQGAGRRRAALMGRAALYGMFSALAWLAYLGPDGHEFRSWEDVYFFCGEEYQHCTASFRWGGSGWVQALVLWNFVLSSAVLLQKGVVALGLGGLLPGEEVVTRESFVSIAWRLVPYWMNQWEQQWGAECSSMLFELPHFALELLVVLPCVQILCGRLRVMAQPHVREPPPLPAQPPGAAVGGAGNQAPPAVAAAAAAAGGAGGGGPGGAAAADAGHSWVPDVMRCRWRHDPAQARLLPRLRANLRAMAILTVVLAVAASNSLLVPMALERLPATSARADQILRFRRELSFVVTAGRRADNALWYQRVAAAAAAASSEDDSGGGADAGGGGSEGDDSLSLSSSGEVEVSGGGSGGGGGDGGAAGFLAAALEGSSNSSRLEAKLAVWSTLWRPLLPPHWLRAVLTADASQVAGLDAAYLSALQWEEHPQSAALARQLHAAANDASAVGLAAAALQRLVHHPEEAGSALPAPAGSGRGEAGSPRGDGPGGAASGSGGGGGTDAPMVHLLLMASMAAGIDARTAPLQLAAARVLDSPEGAAAAAGSEAGGAALQADLRWLRHQQALYAAKLAPLAGDGTSGAGSSADGGGGGGASSWQVQQRMAPLYRLLQKHCAELERMRSPDHKRLIPLVEVSLAIMRLSCERFFSLLAVFLGFLLFRDPPPAAQRAIRVVAAVAAVFQRLVLYSFPAICWAYGAGALFSSFVSVVFWTGPLVRAVERVRNAATSVQPRQWHAATSEEVERMAGQCAICWGDMPVPSGGAGGSAGSSVATAGGAAETVPPAQAAAAGPGAPVAADVHTPPPPPPPRAGSPSGAAGCMALPCGHAYHRECLQQWLQQCYGQARSATCPMCQASIALRVRYRMPWQRPLLPAGAAEGEGAAGGGGAAAAEGIPGLAALAQQLQEDFRARFEPMLDAALPADAQGWPPADAVIPPPLPAAHGLPPWQRQKGKKKLMCWDLWMTRNPRLVVLRQRWRGRSISARRGGAA
ncbi:E3 ubiquitin-ligase synoviolin [Micractinium conductrix]|uniref:E3 ubiquitin-ligase synoviolin n=1 Tax=Micractinium conductrix TaxID=554055 RepID=A0A2P6V385_9CHLO|nr:E3 ubiquitin-ligase synoviolin [Micractinium conductrix]|eukprot:PSC68550.1 E3 ubiquitin-ligase synoviolin [Micractinium conductrix]